MTIASNPFRVEITPAAGAVPAWLQGVPLRTWVPVSSSRIIDVSHPGICAYSGATLRGAQVLLAGGGHGDYYGNEVLGYDLLADSPQWTIVGAASPSNLWAPAVTHYADGKPSATHSYWTLHWVEQHGRMFRTGGVTAYSSNYVFSPYNDAFSPSTGQWDAAGTWPNVLSAESGKGSVSTPSHIWEFNGSATLGGQNHRLLRCDLATMAWTDCGTVTGGHDGDNAILHDPVRNRLVRLRGSVNYSTAPRYWSLDGYTSGMPPSTGVTITGAAPVGGWGGIGLTYCADTDRYLAVKWKDTTGTVYSIHPETFVSTVMSISGAPDWSGLDMNNDGLRVYGARFAYVADLKGVLMIHSPNKPAYFLRTG